MAELAIELLGGFRVTVDGRPIEEHAWNRRKAQNLVKLLALTHGHRLHREQLMEQLWPNTDPDSAGNNLRQTIYLARKTLQSVGPGDFHFIQQESSWVEMQAPQGIWVDVEEFELQASLAQKVKNPQAYHSALKLYKGELLPGDIYEDWTVSRRETLRQLQLTLLLELASVYEAEGEIRQAIETLKQVVELEPIQEEAQADLMRLYALAGWRYQALRQYDELREVLRKELEVEPSESSQKLYQEIMEGSYLSSAVPLKPVSEAETGHRSRHNLPNLLTRFIGREAEIVEIKRLLGRTRLLTLTGAGGSGKTRLALQIAFQLVDDYPDGVWFVELAGLRDSAHVSRTVLAALEVAEQPSQDNTETLIGYLRSKNLLIVLDNCEYVLEGCTDLSIALLKQCPELKILANSRHTLGVNGEMIWPVVGLNFPPPLEPSQYRSIQSPNMEEIIEKSEAVRLFCDRAQHIQPRFEITEQNVNQVAQICRSLDGLPLAIELAAARLNVLSPQEIAARLNDRFRLLTTRNRDVVDRHQTMRAAVDWSYDLLNPEERILFNRLSVFRGSFTLDAAEALWTGTEKFTREDRLEIRSQPTPADRGVNGDPIAGLISILDLLSSLIEKSMVISEQSERTNIRYRLLETLRQYGEERLVASGEAETIQHCHAKYYLAYAEDAEPKLRGHDQAAWFIRVETEHDNLRAALNWAFNRAETKADPEAAEIGVRLAQSLWWFWYTRGYWGEGRDWYTKSLSLPVERMSPLVQVRCYIYASLFAISPGDQTEALELADKGLALAQNFEDEEGIAISLLRKGRLIGRKDPSLGTAMLEESLAIFRRLGDQFFIGTAHYYLSFHLGWTFLNSGDYAQATHWLKESLASAEALGARLGAAIALSTMAQIARIQGDFEKSEELFRKGLEICQQYGEDYQASASLANILYGLGQLAFAQGDHRQAYAYQKEALELQQKWGMLVEMTMSLEALAILFASERKAEKAIHLFAAAQAYRQAKGYRRTKVDEIEYNNGLTQARADCEEEIFLNAWAEGQAMDLNQAMAAALAVESE